MAGIITAVASVAVVLGAILAFLLTNERRITRLEKGEETIAAATKETTERIDAAIKALHDRLDGYFLGEGPRARKKES